MAWITERKLWKATSFHSLIEFLWESSLRPDAQEASLARGLVGWGGGHLLPHVDGGHSELHSFQPQNHEEPLAKGTVAHVLTIVSSLKKKTESDQYCFSWPNAHFFSADEAMTAISGPLPTWQTSDFRGERRVSLRDYSPGHCPHLVKTQAVTEVHLLRPLKSQTVSHIILLIFSPFAFDILAKGLDIVM